MAHHEWIRAHLVGVDSPVICDRHGMWARTLVAALPVLVLMACASPTQQLMQNLTVAVLDQDDPQTVAQGAPAYLLLVDGLIADAPDNEALLLAGARLYTAYASAFADGNEARGAGQGRPGGAFAEDPARAQRLTARARAYAERALCAHGESLCALRSATFDDLTARLARVTVSEVGLLYGYAVSWAGWIQARPSDWSAIADLPKVRVLLERVVALEDGHDGGGAHLYLAVLESLLPAAAGGRPEQARAYFERALALSDGRNLTAKVLFAERYARPQFDRALHDRLLGEVLAADPHAPGRTLMNTLAQQRAARLLANADQYF
jgi:hypothetical protein